MEAGLDMIIIIIVDCSVDKNVGHKGVHMELDSGNEVDAVKIVD